MIFLFTDFGASDIYVGQVKAVLQQRAPRVPVVDLMHDAPPFNVKAGAHLLAALATRVPEGSVVLTVVDPGVGGPREPVAVLADGRWFVGPDNGLISVVAERAKKREYFVIGWWPDDVSVSFHGRDLFAPVAAMLAGGRRKAAKLGKTPRLAVTFGPSDFAEIIYVDHYGNAFTGLRASKVSPRERLVTGSIRIDHARVFSGVKRGAVFWYENSVGLVEIAANSTNAAAKFGLRVGHPLAVEPG
jgi:S-adenosyl-L-methionine hydrolase (adenosine-forming)